MQNNTQRISLIRERLQHAFSPTHLEVLDDSAEHVGHVGSQGGAGHYTVVIVSEHFKALTRVDIHRKIYAVLADLIPDQVHALRIKASSIILEPSAKTHRHRLSRIPTR